MRKLWLVAKHEYLKRVRKRSFLLALLGIPALIVGVGAISVLVMLYTTDTRPLGYVDHAGFLDTAVVSELQAQESRFVDIRAYPDEEAARAALKAERIQAYYVVGADYRDNPVLRLYYLSKSPAEMVQEDFVAFVHACLLHEQPEAVRQRLSQGTRLAIRSLDGRRELSSENVLGFVLPLVASFFLYFAIAITGGYMLQAVTDEKENRTMEVLATSLAPQQLMGGKALGLMGVVLTQLLVWGGAALLGLVIAGRFVEIPGSLVLPWDTLLIIVMFFLPTFALISGLMTAIGAAVTEEQQGQQISGIVNMFFIFPVFFSALLFVDPGHPMLVFLTLFPTSSFITILMRWSFDVVPLWQLVVAWLLVTGAAGGAIWLAARIFRMGMLRYGQRLRLKTILAGLRE
ncbi:MAG: ABC transporter permease [Anaerolineae bacterium]